RSARNNCSPATNARTSMIATVILPQVGPPVDVPRNQLNRYIQPQPTTTVNNPVIKPASAAAAGCGVLVINADRARLNRVRVAPAASPVAVRARRARRDEAALTAANRGLAWPPLRDAGREGCFLASFP